MNILESFYTQYGEKKNVALGEMVFDNLGRVACSGSDSIGYFTFNGEYKDGFFTLYKRYDNHTVYYIGKLIGNSIHMEYFFNEYELSGQKSLYDVSNCNSQIVIGYDNLQVEIVNLDTVVESFCLY